MSLVIFQANLFKNMEIYPSASLCLHCVHADIRIT